MSLLNLDGNGFRMKKMSIYSGRRNLFVIALREQDRCLASKWNFVPLRHPQLGKDVRKSQKATSLTINLDEILEK